MPDLDFLEDKHVFNIETPGVRFAMDFGKIRFYGTMLPVDTDRLDAMFLNRSTVFNSGAVSNAIKFSAECHVKVEKQHGDAVNFLKKHFEFGFIQAIKADNIILDYWGKSKEDGRMLFIMNMPNRFEIDTAPVMQPWNHAKQGRYKAEKSLFSDAKSNVVKISASSVDHPIWMFPKTLKHTNNRKDLLIRSFSGNRKFVTIFAVKKIGTKDITAISFTSWDVGVNYTVRYIRTAASNDLVPIVKDNIFHPAINRQGIRIGADTSSNIIRMIIEMARDESPLVTPDILKARLSTPLRNIQDTNEDFVASFQP